MAQHSRLAPDGLTPIPLFPPTLTSHQVLVGLLSVASPGPVTMPVPGYIQMAGSVPDDRLLFASEPRLYENIQRFNSCSPTVLIRDVSCALAGLNDTHVADLGSFTGAVLGIGGGRGFGPYMQDQLNLFGSTDVVLRLEPDFGHIDHFMTPHHRRFVERPLLRWVRRVFGE